MATRTWGGAFLLQQGGLVHYGQRHVRDVSVESVGWWCYAARCSYGWQHSTTPPDAVDGPVTCLTCLSLGEGDESMSG